MEDNTHDEGIDGVACSTKRAASEDVRCATYLKEHIDHKHPNAHLDDFLVVGKSTKEARSCQSKQDRACKRDDHRPTEEVVAQDIGSLMPPLAYEMPHEDIAALRDADAEQIDEHNHVVAVGACGECLVADLIDEIGDDHLRKTIADVLAHGGDTYLQQIPEFLPRHRTEVTEREPSDVDAEMDNRQQYHRDSPARSSSYGRTLDT